MKQAGAGGEEDSPSLCSQARHPVSDGHRGVPPKLQILCAVETGPGSLGEPPLLTASPSAHTGLGGSPLRGTPSEFRRAPRLLLNSGSGLWVSDSKRDVVVSSGQQVEEMRFPSKALSFRREVYLLPYTLFGQAHVGFFFAWSWVLVPGHAHPVPGASAKYCATF